MEATRGGDVAAEAERIFKHVRHTHYKHEPVIDPRNGTYDVDCSAFVAYVLETVAPEHLALLTQQTGAPKPLAHDFYDFFASPNLPAGWSRIAKLEDARRGDVIAWRIAAIKPGEDTGHVFVVARTPDYDAAAGAWVVHAYDSSDTVHYDDSREKHGRFHTGVGTGAIRFHVDHAGAPTTFQFGLDDKFHHLPIAIGRLERLTSTTKGSPHAHTPGPEHASPLVAGAVSPGHRIARAAVANTVLGDGEFALTTYGLAAATSMLLPPTAIAYWGPGQTIAPSLGNGNSTFTLLGGVVFRNL